LDLAQTTAAVFLLDLLGECRPSEPTKTFPDISLDRQREVSSMPARHRISKKISLPPASKLIGLTDLAGSVLRVGGGGRGFLVAAGDARYIITAAHCLPFLPPPHLARYLEEGTYVRLIGPLGAKPSITAACVFADPVADIAVLGAPDNQAFSDECERFETFTLALPPFDIAAPPPPSRKRLPPFGDNPPGFVPSEVAFPAHLLSLESAWLDVTAHHYRSGALSITPEKSTVNGMSGSPLISATGAAIGVVSTSNIAACLTNGLPGWFLRKLA
jgi:hypothetical protein